MSTALRRIVATLAILALCLIPLSGSLGVAQAQGIPPAAADTTLPIFQNLGQLEASVDFHLQGTAHEILLAKSGVTLTSYGQTAASLGLAFVDASPTALEGVNRWPNNVQFLFADDEANPLTGVPVYSGVRYENLYAGIPAIAEALIDGDTERYQFKRTLELADPDSLKSIIMSYPGSKGLSVDEDGGLIIDVGLNPKLGAIRDSLTMFYVNDNLQREPIEAVFVPNPDGTVYIEAAQAITRKAFVEITLDYSVMIDDYAELLGQMAHMPMAPEREIAFTLPTRGMVTTVPTGPGGSNSMATALMSAARKLARTDSPAKVQDVVVGQDFGGADLIVNDGDVLSGHFTNIGLFQIPAGATVFVDPGVALYVHADKIVIEGSLDGAGRGYAGGIATNLRGAQGVAGSGPGGGSRGVMGPIVHGTGGGGAGHGGYGGAGQALRLPLLPMGGGGIYDLEPDSIQMGSGGGGAANHADLAYGRGGAGGFGGAGIYLDAPTIALDGAILVDGANGSEGTLASSRRVSGGGGGSGGGVLFKGTLACGGSAQISARGGSGGDVQGSTGWGTGGGGGAGGRIKLVGDGDIAACQTVVEGGEAGADMPGVFRPALPGGPGGKGSAATSADSQSRIDSLPGSLDGNDGSVESITEVDQVGNVCSAVVQNFSNLVPTVINDNALVTSSINVSGALPYLLDVDVQTNIIHTWASDLDVTVTSPNGTISTLTTDNDGSNDNVFNGTIWDDDANPGSPASAQPQPPIQGLVTEHTFTNLVTATPLVPEEALGAFVGGTSNGIWTLSIFDDAGGDTGTVTWTITIRSCATAPAPTTVNVSNGISTAINDLTTNSSTINVSGAPNVITDVNATTFIVHASTPDLDISLTSPSGTSVTLSNDCGSANFTNGTCSGANVYNGTLWNDSADPGGLASTQTPNAASFVATDHTYTAGVPFSPLVPEEAMGAFIGENPNGIWTLQVFDDTAGNTGSFTWSLAIQAFTPAAPTQAADLAVSKTTLPAGQTTVIAGNNLTYRVTTTNLGPSSAAGIVIEDTLPLNTAFISATPNPGAPNGSCVFTASTRLVRCTWATDLPAGGQYFVDILVRVCSGVTCNTVLVNQARTFGAGLELGAQIYREEFTNGIGTFTLANDATTTSDWQFRNNCTSSTSNLGAGHTTPGTLRWGNPAACGDYGGAFTDDFALTPLTPTAACTGNLFASFKYYVNYQEPGSFDHANADVQIIVNGTATRAAGLPNTPGGVGQVTLINDGTANNPNPVWQSASINIGTLLGSIPPNVRLRFEGRTDDGIGNAAQGFIIDDVTLNCDRASGPVDPNLANNQTTLNTTVQRQSTYTLDKTADRREVPTGNEVTYTVVARNLGPSDSAGTVVRDTLPPNFTFVGATTSRGTCTAATPAGSTSTVVTCNVGVLGAPAGLQCATPPIPDTVTIQIRALAATNLSLATVGCPEGFVNNLVEISSPLCAGLLNLGTLSDTAATCVVPKVDPNSQLGCQVHLPILNFQGADDVCTSWIEIQHLGCEPSKAVLVTWGEPGFCPPQAAGPLKVECTGLLVPGSSWIMSDSQIPTGSKSGILFKFTALQLSEVGIDLGFDDVVADLMCEELFFGVVGDADDYRRFKKAYNEGLEFRGINQGIAMGDGALAVEVLRKCPGDLTPGVDVTGKYNGIAGDHLGLFDNIFGGFSYYVPLVYADKAGLNSVMYIQNGGIECSSIEIWFKAQDDCLRARICDITTLAPGETYQYDATDCVGPDWQGSAWVRSSEPMGIVVDIYGRDILMTYVAEPAPFNYIFTTDDDPELKLFRPGNRVLFGPLIYSEYQGWDTGIQVQNIDPTVAAKVKVYFLDRSGDIITTLVDWICPRGSQTYFLPIVAKLPGNWVGSVRVESQDWWTPGALAVRAPSIVGVAQLIKYSDAVRTNTEQAIAYSLLPEHKAYNWQVGYADGGLDQGVGLIAIPSFLKDLDGSGVTTEVAIMNLAEKPGFTDFAIYIYDQNGLLDFVCQKLHDRQVEYIDLQTWGYVGAGFRGSAIISATFWEHDVFNPTGEFVRNLVGLGAVSVERTNTRLGEDVPGDEAAGDRGIPFRNDADLQMCFPEGFVPKCPGQPVFP